MFFFFALPAWGAYIILEGLIRGGAYIILEGLIRGGAYFRNFTVCISSFS